MSTCWSCDRALFWRGVHHVRSEHHHGGRSIGAVCALSRDPVFQHRVQELQHGAEVILHTSRTRRRRVRGYTFLIVGKRAAPPYLHLCRIRHALVREHVAKRVQQRVAAIVHVAVVRGYGSDSICPQVGCPKLKGNGALATQRGSNSQGTAGPDEHGARWKRTALTPFGGGATAAGSAVSKSASCRSRR